MRVSIRCYGDDNQLIAEKYVNEVHIERNKKTVLTGKLFDFTGVSSDISINDDWSEETINKGF